MRTLLPLCIAPLFLTGCGSGITGVWLLQIQFATDQATTCNETIDHNFTDADPPDEEEEENNNTSSRSDSLVFVDIQEGYNGNAVMVVESEIYPGFENDDGSWSFSWMGTQTMHQEESTDSYDFTSDTDNSSNQVFKVNFESKALAGNLTSITEQVASYTETDTADPAPPFPSEIPAATWLVKQVGENTMPASNRFDAEDCDSDPCELSVTATCNTQQSVTGSLTGYQDADDYGAVSNARQASGL